ncbi:hypothetical protein JCM1393_17910 [Clostridium carnis]
MTFCVQDIDVRPTVTIKAGKTKVENLYLGEYYWIEKKAPEGYLLDTTKHYFEISYAGENVETCLTSISWGTVVSFV